MQEKNDERRGQIFANCERYIDRYIHYTYMYMNVVTRATRLLFRAIVRNAKSAQ